MHVTANPRTRGCLPVWLALVALSAGACGAGQGGKGGSVTVTTRAGADSATVTIEAHDIYFDPAEVTAPAGEIVFDLVERGGQTHTLLFDEVDDFKLSVSGADQDDSGALVLEPGEYTYYCDIPGHRAQGMVGTLTIE